MKKFIKFVMSKGSDITLPSDIAERLIDSDGQLLKIPNPDGSWSGKLINKAHIVSTDHDIHKEQWSRDKFTPRIYSGEKSKKEIARVEKVKQQIKDKFKIKQYGSRE